ncbi:MAG TPA: hypothetical protein ENI23_15395 [bacterium]|nr:hypothetical protein [bacterium]
MELRLEGDCEDETANNNDCVNTGCVFNATGGGNTGFKPFTDGGTYISCLKTDGDFLNMGNVVGGGIDRTLFVEGRFRSKAADNMLYGCQVGEERDRITLIGGSQFFQQANGDDTLPTSTISPTIGSDYNIISVYDDSDDDAFMYINGTLAASVTDSTTDRCDSTDQYVAAHNSGGASAFSDLDINRVCIWSVKLTAAERAELNVSFCDGTPLVPVPVVDPELSEFTITGIDTSDGVSLENITITIFNTSDSFDFTTGNGTILVNNRTIAKFNVTYNVTFASNESGVYINRTFRKINISEGGSFIGDIYQAILRINVSEVITNISITDFNTTLLSQKNKSNATGFTTLFLRAGSFDVSLDAAGWMTTGTNGSIKNLEDNFLSMVMGTSNLTVTALSSDGTVNDFNTTRILLSTGFTETTETNTGKVIFPSIVGTFNITMNSTGLAFASQPIIISAGNTLPNITFNLFSSNSINITIFDEELNELLNSTIVTLIMDHVDQKFTNTTISGSSFFIDLFDGLWNLLASTPFHNQREYIFTIVPQSTSSLNVYLLNSSNGEPKTFTIKNKKDQTIPDATVTVSNKINTTFVTVAQSISDFAGQVNIFLSSSNEYRFTIEAPNFNTKIFDLVPVVQSYNIILDEIDIIDFTTVFDRVSYTILPSSNILTPSDGQNISIITSSPEGIISYFGLNSSFNSTSERITNVSGSPSGGTATILINTSLHNSTTIPVDFFIKLPGEEIILIHKDYRTSLFVTPGNHSAQNFADKYKDQFSEVFKALIVVLVAVAVILSLAEMGAPAVINGVAGTVIIIAGAVVGWIPLFAAIFISFIILGMYALRRGD